MTLRRRPTSRAAAAHPAEPPATARDAASLRSLHRKANAALALAGLAAFAALGGPAQAASGVRAAGRLVDGKDLKRGSITGSQLRDGSVTAADLAPGSVGGTQLRDGAITQADLAPGLALGTTGPQGPRGLAGAVGADGPPGPRGVPGTPAPTYTAGTGLGLAGDVFSADLTTLQARLTGSCPAGASIRAISPAGDPTCEPDDAGGVPSGSAGGALAGTYPSPALADDAVTAPKLADNAVASLEVAPDSLQATDLAASSVGSSEVALNSLTADDLAINSVGLFELQDGTASAQYWSSSQLQGVTVTGAFGTSTETPSQTLPLGTVSFPLPLNAPPKVVVVYPGDPFTSTCNGTADAPNAQSGFVCFYIADRTGTTTLTVLNPAAPTAPGKAGKQGALLRTSSDASAGTHQMSGTWAFSTP